MTKSVFDYLSYKAYLSDLIRQNPNYGHGFKSKIAKALNCQTAYLSQVLNRGANFSLEQAADLNQLLAHGKDEAKFFILLVQLERAGTTLLKNFIKNEINEIIARREVLKERVVKSDSLSTENQMKYYSRWYFSALHMLATIPELQTKEAMARALQLPLNIVSDALEFLETVGLVKSEGGKFTPGATQLFLGSDSPMIAQLHSNWRIKSLESLSRDFKNDLHYSSCATLSKSDFRAVKELLIKSINEARAIIKNSKEEELICFTLDFFSLL
ncbi:MAG: TIGR02147 family protein [Bdellovibrionales bacterium]